ncbi:thiamine ABC transporter substrate-binding protein [Rhodobacteraceae bacterium]|nr:thiamine ABC transporter substrate-binding protein [Paracoccaceae bacterium]
MRFLIFLTGIFLATFAYANRPVLTVYAPDYFVSEWGPGPSIEEAFEKTCGCDLKFSAGDLVPRLILEGSSTEADIVIGLNTDVTKKARETGLFAPHEQSNESLFLPIRWIDNTFLPFNWSYVSFVYDETKISQPPKSFEDLANMKDAKIVIQDPRSSISGLALVLWVKEVYGDKAEEYWLKLAPNILTVTKGWSEAYGLFTSGEAEIVLSFNTSPAYHISAEGDQTKKAAIFDEGHYAYFELVGKLRNSDQPELAEKFMKFVLSNEFQTLIPFTNWSYPAAQDRSNWPEVFVQLPYPKRAYFLNEAKADTMRKKAIEEWRTALSQ